jgi:hypothetical protein
VNRKELTFFSVITLGVWIFALASYPNNCSQNKPLETKGISEVKGFIGAITDVSQKREGPGLATSVYNH